MSIDKTVYTVLGYDISEWREQILTDDFRWSDLYEEITNGEIRLFTGSGCREDNFLYFGFPLFESEEYGETSPITLDFDSVKEIDEIQKRVNAEWSKYIETFAVVDRLLLPFEIICFEEYS